MKMKSLLIAGSLALGMLGGNTYAVAKDVRMFIRHDVADYAVWRKGYDAYSPTQKKMGVVFEAVYQSTDNPNDVTVIHDFRNMERAKAFAASSDLKETMGKLGVKGAPQIWYTNKGAKARKAAK
jgi:hypothetical protein